MGKEPRPSITFLFLQFPAAADMVSLRERVWQEEGPENRHISPSKTVSSAGEIYAHVGYQCHGTQQNIKKGLCKKNTNTNFHFVTFNLLLRPVLRQISCGRS